MAGDNLSVHRMKAVRSAIESFGETVLFLPPYSPELNPIEHTQGLAAGGVDRQLTRTPRKDCRALA
ncbi:MAG: hypothetical protein ACJAZO_004092 [Myxococcota bacterium]